MQCVQAKIVKKTQIGEGAFGVTFSVESLPHIKAGQFALVSTGRADLILKRPFAICGANYKNNTFDIAFEVRGKGTESLAALCMGEVCECLLPLGNGFSMEGMRIMLVAGGCGAAAIAAAVNFSAENKQFFATLGYKSAQNAYFASEFKQKCAETRIFSDDGTIGEKGFATSGLKEYINKIKPDAILACGPAAMYKAMKDELAGIGVRVQVSLEERMGCGIGACLVCACKIAAENGEAHNLRVCRDGPVFDLAEVAV